MVELMESRRTIFVLLVFVVVASGCIQTSSTNLDPDFDIEYVDKSVNRSDSEIYNNSMSSIAGVSNYSVGADNRMAMNLPVMGLSANMTSEGFFENETYEINSSGNMELSLGSKFNVTKFNTTIGSQESVEDGLNQTGKQYSGEDLGISLEALRGINVEDARVLGVSNLSGEKNFLLNLTVNNSDLMDNSERIFEVHSPVQESTDEGGDMSESEEFEESKAYLWVNSDNKIPSKFAYYGSAHNGSIQVKSITEYSVR